MLGWCTPRCSLPSEKRLISRRVRIPYAPFSAARRGSRNPLSSIGRVPISDFAWPGNRRQSGSAGGRTLARLPARDERRVKRRVGFPTGETAKGSQKRQRLLDRTVAGEATQMPLQPRELCRIKSRRPVRHVLDLDDFVAGRTRPSSCVDSTFAQLRLDAKLRPRSGQRRYWASWAVVLKFPRP